MYQKRIDAVRKELAERGLDALYLTNGISFLYLTGYSYIATERPAALVIPIDDEITFMGPLLEADHIPLRTSLIGRIRTYPDYPGQKHPMTHFAYFLRDLGLSNKVIGIDNLSGASGRWGYRGSPIVKKMPKARFVEARDIVENMRIVKSSEEITLIRESAKWGNLAHTLLQEFTSPGLWDYDIAMRASLEASLIMKKTLGPEYQAWRQGGSPASAGFRGQIGSMSAIPHALSTKMKVKKGDVVISGAGADVGGYNSELERTMIVGKPTAKQKRFFRVMLNAQNAALAAFKPGAKCSDVDRKASKVIQKVGWTRLMRHHTGHGIGLEGHEPPWLDIGDNTIMKPGMVFSCEPGIYEPGFAGFRHSDTVVITEDGSERITYYPRDLESLTI